MREIVGQNSTLYWLLTDHRGLLTQPCSQSITANADGSFHSEVRYTAFGETRYTSANNTPTDYLYTGQRLEEEAGLYYYNARFYDAALAHFIQADTVVVKAEYLLSYLKYVYVNFNPLFYIDPSGHFGTGWSEDLDTGNSSVEWASGGLYKDSSSSSGGIAGPDLTGYGDKQKKLFEKYKDKYPGSTIYDFIAFQLGQEFASYYSYDQFTCTYAGCRGLEGNAKEAALLADLRTTVVNNLFSWSDYNYGKGNLTHNSIFNWLGAAFESARNNAENGNVSLEGQTDYGRFLGNQMSQAILENVIKGTEIKIVDISPRAWGNQGLWDHGPEYYGVTPLWTISGGDAWYLLTNSGNDIMDPHRVK